MTNLDTALPGYTAFDLPEGRHQHWTNTDWEEEFQITNAQIDQFLQVRDPFIILARSAARLLTERRDPESDHEPIEQSVVELTQAMILRTRKFSRTTPTSPGNLVRLWSLIERNQAAFLHRTTAATGESLEAHILHRAQLQTSYYRNLFTQEDCERFVQSILTKIEQPSNAALSYSLSKAYTSLSHIADHVRGRMEIFHRHLQTLLRTKDREVLRKEIAFFRGMYPVANRAWRSGLELSSPIEQLRSMAFQLSELAYPWVFTIPNEALDKVLGSDRSWIDKLCLSLGDLASVEREHIYLNNPVWKHPYIRINGGGLFAALPYAPFSFPFAILEELMEGQPQLLRSYERARSASLEEEIAKTIRVAAPSARVYDNVVWTSPDDGQSYENDVVAVIGNFIFMFEAKSGKIKDGSRRGGRSSLEKNFKELFVEPGIQAFRLQSYLDKYQSKAEIRTKSDGRIIDLGLTRRKIVYRFSICIEHFASLTSAKYYLKELGVINDDTAWAPVLSLGELLMIAKFLDTEVSFVHYLTRRATLEDLIQIEGDEQDYLSLYLTNGLWLNAEAFDGQRLLLHNSDSLVRVPKVARDNRLEFALQGVQLSPLWFQIARELYQNEEQVHRFDLVTAILNQLPPALADIEKRIRRWRRGASHNGEDVLSIRFKVSERNYIVAVYLAKKPMIAPEWRDVAHGIVAPFAAETGMADCAVFMMLRKTKSTTFDGVSFFRFARRI
ncbi:hypothetical protein AB9F35_09630 [Rhizobium leguminosarum]|uniref:hypothetical protein n=1 Tax=Rhizobium leguminosarum TaxID=384 RepID=UPI003F96086E